MARWTAGVLVLGLAAAPSVAQDAAAADTIKKAITAHGGADNLNKYPASVSKMTGKISLMGLDLAIAGTMTSAVPGKVKLDMTADLMGQKVTIQQVVNGDKVQQRENGRVSKLTDLQEGELRQMGAAQEVSLLTPLLDAKKFTLTAEKDATVGGNRRPWSG
jgi:hypothetical protein